MCSKRESKGLELKLLKIEKKEDSAKKPVPVKVIKEATINSWEPIYLPTSRNEKKRVLPREPRHTYAEVSREGESNEEKMWKEKQNHINIGK